MFTCSIGDEVASHEEQMKAKNDRQLLVAKYRKLQAEFDKLAAKKKADHDTLTQELRELTEQKKKELLEVTCSHTLQITQLQSNLMGDIDLYYTKSKQLEEEAERKQETILDLKEKLRLLERESSFKSSGNNHRFQTSTATVVRVSHDTDTEGCSITSDRTEATSTKSRESMSTTPPLLTPARAMHAENLHVFGLEQRQAAHVSHTGPPPPSSPSNNMCEGLSLSSVQQWNENLRLELQRVHLEQEAGVGRVQSLKDALERSEHDRAQAEELCDALHDQVAALVNSKEQVLEVVQRVQQENAELKNTLRRMKLL